MSTVKENKALIIDEIREKIGQAEITIFADYRGLNVALLTKFRCKLRENAAEIRVYKNTFSRRALDQLNLSYQTEMLEGPTAVITASKEPTKAAKEVVSFAKDNQSVVVKGGVFENQVLNAEQIQELAKLPSREELIAQAIGSMKSPLTGLVMTISGPVRGLVYVLNSIKEKKSGGES